MNKILLAIFLLTVSVAASAQSAVGEVKKTAATQTYIVVYKPGPKWVVGKPMAEQGLKEHFKYMVGLYSTGVMKFAGPFAKDAGGAVVFEAAGDADALRVVESDPAVIGHIFVFELNRWDLVTWDRYVKK